TPFRFLFRMRADLDPEGTPRRCKKRIRRDEVGGNANLEEPARGPVDQIARRTRSGSPPFGYSAGYTRGYRVLFRHFLRLCIRRRNLAKARKPGLLKLSENRWENGGEEGIRTLETVTRLRP